MAFEAKKLVVQLPCGAAGSVIDPAEAPDGGTPIPPSLLHPPPTPPPPPEPPCTPTGTRFLEIPSEVEVLGQPPFRLEPEDLPTLRRTLELRVEAMRRVEREATAMREGVERYLGDVELAARQLDELDG